VKKMTMELGDLHHLSSSPILILKDQNQLFYSYESRKGKII
jgi:hypothetical protein